MYVNLRIPVVKRKLKQWWSTISPISTKRTTASHLHSLNTKTSRRMSLKIQVLAWDKYTNVTGLKRVGFLQKAIGNVHWMNLKWQTLVVFYVTSLNHLTNISTINDYIKWNRRGWELKWIDSYWRNRQKIECN